MRRKIRKFRAYDSEWDVITTRAKRAGFTNFSEFAREMLMNGEIKIYDLSDIEKLNLNLVRIGVNINQIAHVCNELQSVSYNKVAELINEFDEIQKVIEKYVKPLKFTLTVRDIKDSDS